MEKLLRKHSGRSGWRSEESLNGPSRDSTNVVINAVSDRRRWRNVLHRSASGRGIPRLNDTKNQERIPVVPEKIPENYNGPSSSYRTFRLDCHSFFHSSPLAPNIFTSSAAVSVRSTYIASSGVAESQAEGGIFSSSSRFSRIAGRNCA